MELPERELPEKVLAAAGDRRSGATEIAITAAEGLIEVADRPEVLAAAVDTLLAGQPAMAPVWHLARAARAAEPEAALRSVLESLRRDADAAVETARAWLDREVGAVGTVETVSHSSLVDMVLAGRPATAPSAGRAGGGRPAVGLIGADAIGPVALLNAVGSAALAARLPTLVVATAVKLVPGEVFDRLAAPGFERVPLTAVAAVVLGDTLVEPAEAGRRAAALAGHGDPARDR